MITGRRSFAAAVVVGLPLAGCASAPKAAPSAAPTTVATSAASSPVSESTDANQQERNEASAGQSASPTPTPAAATQTKPTAASTVTDADLAAALEQVKGPSADEDATVISGAMLRVSVRMQVEGVSVKPKNCQIVSFGLAGALRDSRPVAAGVFGDSGFGMSAIAFATEAEAKKWIADRNGEAKRCRSMTWSTKTGQVPMKATFASSTPKLTDGQRADMYYGSQLLASQVSGRKGRIVILASKQAPESGYKATLDGLAAQLYAALP